MAVLLVVSFTFSKLQTPNTQDLKVCIIRIEF